MAEPAQFSGRAAPGGGPRSAVVVGALVVAFLVMAVAKPWDHPAPTPSPSTAVIATVKPTAVATLPAQPSATPTASEFPALVPFTLTPPPPRDARWTVIRWQHLDPTNPLAHLGTVLRWAGGYASVGDDGVGGTVLWTSPDGTAWNPIGSGTATTFWPGMHVEGVAPLGRQLLAVTSLPDETASLDASTPAAAVLATWSSDDGAAWQLHGGPILPNPTRLDGPVLVAGSWDRAVIAWNEVPQPGGQATGHLAVTDDGASWRPVPSSALPSGFTVTDLVAAPGGGFVAAGKTFADGLSSAVVMRSDATGRAWTPVALPPDPALAPGERANVVWRLVVGASGILAIGDNPGRELWWWSANGRHWTAVSGFAPIGSSNCSGSTPGCGAYPDGEIVGDGERLVALPYGAAMAWSSSDGRAWQPMAATALAARLPPNRLALLPGGLLLVDGDGVWYGEAASEP